MRAIFAEHGPRTSYGPPGLKFVEARLEFGTHFSACKDLVRQKEIRIQRGSVEDSFAPFEAKAYQMIA